MLDAAKARLDYEFVLQGYNIGINDGPAAGQTVLHLHIHLIPRYTGAMCATHVAACDGSFRKRQTTGAGGDDNPTIGRGATAVFEKRQRLFNDSDFTATYKYALLMSLAELSVEHGRDNGDALWPQPQTDRH